MRVENYPIYNISQEIDVSLSYSAVKRKDYESILECIGTVASEQRVFNTLLNSFQKLNHFAIGYIKDSQVGQDNLGSDYFRFVFLNESTVDQKAEQTTWSSSVFSIVFKCSYLGMPVLLVESQPLDVIEEKASNLEQALKQHNLREDSRFIFVEFIRIVKKSHQVFSIVGEDIEPITEHHADLNNTSQALSA